MAASLTIVIARHCKIIERLEGHVDKSFKDDLLETAYDASRIHETRPAIR